MIAGLPLAYIADTRSRPLVLMIGIAFWSITVLLTGFVRHFWELLVLRIFLGVGEVRMGGAIVWLQVPYVYVMVNIMFLVKYTVSVSIISLLFVGLL